MKNTKFFYYSLAIFVSLLSCNSISKKTDISISHNSSSQNERDTIKVVGFNNIEHKNDSCTVITNKFHEQFGVLISDYYLTLDSLDLDLNNDKLLDKLVVLSPLSLESENNVCKIDSLSKRLVVEIINNNGKSKIRNIYTHLVSDSGGVLSHYNGIFKNKDGFEIIHQAGARYSWTYKMEFSFGEKNNINLIKIIKTCSFDGRDKNLTYNYKNLSANSINFLDTLKQDCNCEKHWEALEK